MSVARRCPSTKVAAAASSTSSSRKLFSSLFFYYISDIYNTSSHCRVLFCRTCCCAYCKCRLTYIMCMAFGVELRRHSKGKCKKITDRRDRKACQNSIFHNEFVEYSTPQLHSSYRKSKFSKSMGI